MPTCPRCKVAFLDGETHSCERKTHRVAVFWSCVAAIYVVLAYEAGSIFQPGAVAIYLLIVLVMGAGRVFAHLLNLLGS